MAQNRPPDLFLPQDQRRSWPFFIVNTWGVQKYLFVGRENQK